MPYCWKQCTTKHRRQDPVVDGQRYETMLTEWPRTIEDVKFGDVASWAVWGSTTPDVEIPTEYAESCKKGESNKITLSIQYERLKDLINSDFIIVAVNWAGSADGKPYGGKGSTTWRNFHSPSMTPFYGPEDKERFTKLFEGTPLEGAYMTDAFKGVATRYSGALKKKTQENPDLAAVMRGILRKERQLLQAGDHPVCWITIGNANIITGEPWKGAYKGISGDGLFREGDRMAHIPFPLTMGEAAGCTIRPEHIHALSETVTAFCDENDIPCSDDPFRPLLDRMHEAAIGR